MIPLKTLTKREKEIYEFIKISSSMHGFSPTLVEIQNHFRLNAVSTVHEHIINLKKKGYITKEMSQARSIRVVENFYTNEEFIEIPISYQLDQGSKLKEVMGRKSYLIHASFLKGKGRYIAILLNNDLYTSSHILKGDVVIIKEASKLPFNKKALINIADEVFIGEIIEHNQLPAFKKYSSNNPVVLKFNIKGEIISLIRDFN